MSGIKDLPSDVKEAADAIAGNWREFGSFVWDTRRTLENAEDYAIVYLSNRDSGCLDKSNEQAILESLADAVPSRDYGDDPTWWEESHSHWAVGHVDGVVIRVRDASGEPTKAFRALHECAMALADYPVLDDEDFSRREWEDELEGWDAYGANDLCCALAKAYPHHDVDFFRAIPNEALCRAWYTIASEPCIHEDSGTYFPFDRHFGERAGACKPSWAEVRETLRDAIVETCYVARCHPGGDPETETPGGVFVHSTCSKGCGRYTCNICGRDSGVVRKSVDVGDRIQRAAS